MITKNQSIVLAMVALLTVALSGCGGGGGGGGSSGGGSSIAPTRSQALEDPITATHTAGAIRRASEAGPRAGSVTQSSNVDSNNITIDQVEVTVRYTPDKEILEVRNGTTWSIDTDEGNARQIPDVTPPWYGAELSKRIEGGVLYVDLYSDIEDPDTRQVDSGDDGIRDVQLGTMILGAGVTLSAGRGITGHRGTLGGEPGTFNCTGSGGCGVANGITTRGMWTFTPDRPPGAEDVSSSDTVAWTGAYNSNRLPGTRNGDQGYFRCLSQSCGHSTSTVNGRTRMMLRGDWIFVSTSGTTTVTTLDTDYLSGGVWLLVPDDATSAADYVFGAFADGSDPFTQSNLTGVQGTATYEGEATGVYSATEAGSSAIGYFDSDVALTADFGDGNDLGTIRGSMTNFEVDGEATDGRLDLGTANIGSQNSGFFKGSVTGSVTGTDADVERSYTGQWGGQFFGNGETDGKPGSVAGTIGGHSTDDTVSFVGAFGAHKE